MRTLILLLMIVFFSLTSHAEEWVYCFSDAAGNNTFYDEDSIAGVGKNLTKIRVRTDYSLKGRAEFIRTLMSRGTYNDKYDQLTHSVTTWYIDCDKKESDLYSVFEYDKQGGIIATYKAKEIVMEPVVYGTIGYILYNMACRRIQK